MKNEYSTFDMKDPMQGIDSQPPTRFTNRASDRMESFHWSLDPLRTSAVDSTIILDSETAHQVPDVVESARGCAFGGEVDSTTSQSGDGECVGIRGDGETDGAQTSELHWDECLPAYPVDVITHLHYPSGTEEVLSYCTRLRCFDSID
ncbi:hypothetical protein LTR22_002688 [Elasticomyces elasticus]|nr:hypothetical protein LTR22_002688 [Elasticomyces elasticus]KAK5767865.1 hypothetical protein LTS12_002018 [Elasticomyces elasticus]